MTRDKARVVVLQDTLSRLIHMCVETGAVDAGGNALCSIRLKNVLEARAVLDADWERDPEFDL